MGSGTKGKEFGAMAIWSCLLLLVALRPCKSLGSSCPAETTRPKLQATNSTPSLLNFNGAFMSPIVNSFLGSVQRNPFPKDLMIKIIQNPTQAVDEETVKEVLKYEIGYLVCVAIGILYIILMPLIGLIFACCRCCGNCGGRMYQKQTPNIHCKRRGLYWSTFFITSLILAGNVCMFLSSSYTSETVQHSPREIVDILGNLKSFLTTVPKQLQQVVDESSVAVDTVRKNLNGSLLGVYIQNGLQDHLSPALTSITDIAQVINRTGVALKHANMTLELLKPKVDELNANLSRVSQNINATLQLPGCVNCSSLQPQLDKLSADADIEFPDQHDLMSNVNKAENADIIGQANEGKDFFDSIPARVSNETSQSVQVALVELSNLKDQISGVTKDLPLNVLENMSSPLTDVQKSISEVSPVVQRSSQYSRIVGLVLCCVILLVVVCNFLGLLMGAVGLNPYDDPTERSCSSNCGGTFFMIGVGFSFLVSWIFMIVVLVLLIVGGNSYTLVCKPWQSRELIQIVDTGLRPLDVLSNGLNLKTNLTIGNVYSDCQMNKPLWTTLHLNEVIDLNSLLNISEYAGQIFSSFENAQISIANITILSPDTKSQLRNFSDSASSLNFSRITQQISDVSQTNLSSSADELDDMASKQTNTIIRDRLREEARELRNIQAAVSSTIMPLLLELNATIKNLSETASQINGSVENVLQRVAYAQDILNYNISQIVKTGSRAFIDCQLEIFLTYISWANQTITGQVGRCGPVAAAVDRAESFLCQHLVASLNAFWFSLGWCMVFLIPSIILSVKLAKFYRRMKSTDVLENKVVINPFPRAQLYPKSI